MPLNRLYASFFFFFLKNSVRPYMAHVAYDVQQDASCFRRGDVENWKDVFDVVTIP
jgi:hypothetical protein